MSNTWPSRGCAGLEGLTTAQGQYCVLCITCLSLFPIIAVIIFFFQVLDCSYLNPRVLPVFNSPPHPTEAGGGRVKEQLLVLSCHLGLNNKKLLCFKTLQPLPVSLPLCQELSCWEEEQRQGYRAGILWPKPIFLPVLRLCWSWENLLFSLRILQAWSKHVVVWITQTHPAHLHRPGV